MIGGDIPVDAGGIGGRGSKVASSKFSRQHPLDKFCDIIQQDLLVFDSFHHLVFSLSLLLLLFSPPSIIHTHKTPTNPHPNIFNIRLGLGLRANILNLSKYECFFGIADGEGDFSFSNIELPGNDETNPSEGDTFRLAKVGEFG